MKGFDQSIWISLSRWLTPRRLRAHALVLAVCLWGVCIADFATPGFFDRGSNVKFQDFLQFYISARLIREGRASQLYDQQIADDELHEIVGPSEVRLPTVYGPQVGLWFLPLSYFSFFRAAAIWAAISVLLYCACIYAYWRSCPHPRIHLGTVAIVAIAYPPLFHFFVRGQLSAVILACFTAAFLAWRANQPWLAGIALGLLVFKPQFLVAIPLILLLAADWSAFIGLVASSIAQLSFARLYFGSGVMHSYFDMLLHPQRWMSISELSLSPIQMHSLRSFWILLIPWPVAALVLYILSSLIVLVLSIMIWKSESPFALRFSALTLAAILINPHLFIYDLLALAPAFLLIADFIAAQPEQEISAKLRVLLYLAFLLPLFGALSRWTHVQLSVPVFVLLLWTLHRERNQRRRVVEGLRVVNPFA